MAWSRDPQRTGVSDWGQRMLIGRVVGTLVASRKDDRLEGLKLFLVRNLDLENREAPGYVVAADTVGAGLDEVVLYVRGSSARVTDLTDGCPVDAAIMAIVDLWDLEGEIKYQKGGE
jgi:microcompartment protein CcmK/EutM